MNKLYTIREVDKQFDEYDKVNNHIWITGLKIQNGFKRRRWA